MAQDGLAFRREDGMGASGVNAALACVLGLTDDIVVMFGDDGLVTLQGASAPRLVPPTGRPARPPRSRSRHPSPSTARL